MFRNSSCTPLKTSWSLSWSLLASASSFDKLCVRFLISVPAGRGQKNVTGINRLIFLGWLRPSFTAAGNFYLCPSIRKHIICPLHSLRPSYTPILESTIVFAKHLCCPGLIDFPSSQLLDSVRESLAQLAGNQVAHTPPQNHGALLWRSKSIVTAVTSPYQDQNPAHVCTGWA